MKKEDNLFFYVGLYFVFIEIAFLLTASPSLYPGFFWSCNIVPIFFAIGFLTKNIQLIKGVINFIFIPHLVFVILSIIFFTTNISIWTIKSCYPDFIHGFMTFYLHAFSANVALFFTLKIKPTKKSLYYALIAFLLVFLLTILFTAKEDNVNFVYSTKLLIGTNIPFITPLWPLFAFLVLVVPTYYFQKFLAKKLKNEHK
jgi:hypothetical protein